MSKSGATKRWLEIKVARKSAGGQCLCVCHTELNFHSPFSPVSFDVCDNLWHRGNMSELLGREGRRADGFDWLSRV